MAAARCSDSQRLRRARFADQQQRAVGDQRGDGDFDEPLVADVFGRDVQLAAFAAADISQHRARRHPPTCRQRMFFRFHQRVQFLGEKNLGRYPQVLLSFDIMVRFGSVGSRRAMVRAPPNIYRQIFRRGCGEGIELRQIAGRQVTNGPEQRLHIIVKIFCALGVAREQIEKYFGDFRIFATRQASNDQTVWPASGRVALGGFQKIFDRGRMILAFAREQTITNSSALMAASSQRGSQLTSFRRASPKHRLRRS